MIDKLKILYHYLNRPKFESRDKLECWQDKQVKSFLKKILKKSPFYKNYYEKCCIGDWREFPVIDKAVMMDNFDALNTVKITKEKAFEVALKAEKERDFTPAIGNITVGLSSGTSGNRGVFLVNPQERCKWAGKILAKILPYSIFKSHRIAFFLRANSNLYTTVQSGKIKFEFFDLLNPIETHVQGLNSFGPTILIAPPSVLRMLAQAKDGGVLNISPDKIISVAEVLEPIDEHYIAVSFGQKLHQVYQATEGFIASTCQYGTLHLNEDMIVVQKEYVDESAGKFIPIITDFSRTTQPIIRYRLNDILTERKEPCPCKSHYTAIEKIEGRCDDIFYLKDTNGDYKPVFPDYISRAVMYASEFIDEYKVVQFDNSIKIYLRLSNNDLRNEIETSVKNELNMLFSRLGILGCEIDFDNYLNENKDRKMKRVERKIGVC